MTDTSRDAVPREAGATSESFDVDGLMRLWTDPLPVSDDEAVQAFAEFYTNPVTVNGAALTLTDLVERARAVQRTFAQRSNTVLDLADQGGKLAVAFRMSGRQIGPLPTALGLLAPTGAELAIRVIDLLTLTDGRISNIWMVADELGTLVSVDAVTWRTPTT